MIIDSDSPSVYTRTDIDVIINVLMGHSLGKSGHVPFKVVVAEENLIEPIRRIDCM